MRNLSDTFRECETLKTNENCPRCKGILYRKRIKIDTSQFKGLRKMGIIFKAVDFCINLDCNYIEQGVLYFNGKKVLFLNLHEFDKLIINKTGKDKD
ncbi:MAG: hypothetical protein ACFFBP_12230 [Promethearchaeota archaeon]